MSRTINLLAGVPQEFYEVSNFFRILAAAGPLSVEFYYMGREVAEALDVTDGYAERFETGVFDRVRLVSPADQTVQFVQRLGNVVQYDKAPVGDTNIVNGLPTVVQAVNTVTNASAQLLAANTARKMLVIQNKSRGKPDADPQASRSRAGQFRGAFRGQCHPGGVAQGQRCSGVAHGLPGAVRSHRNHLRRGRWIDHVQRARPTRRVRAGVGRFARG